MSLIKIALKRGHKLSLGVAKNGEVGVFERKLGRL